jgi:polysaccharide pyruvyl transferase WcaK-like protein
MSELCEYKPKAILGKWWEQLEDVDVVISQGGGYMIKDGMATHLEGFKTAQKLNKPVYFATQTYVGPISEHTKRLLKEVMSKARLVVAREEQSKNLLVSAGVEEKDIKVLPDQVFSMKPTVYPNKLPENAIKIGIRSYAASDEFLKEIAMFADMVVETVGKVVFVPIGHGSDRDDRDGIRKMQEYMIHESIGIYEKINITQLMDILKDGVLISDRYHGIVSALRMNIPVIALNRLRYAMLGLNVLIVRRVIVSQLRRVLA